jgi:diaminopimelate epimerase
MRQKCSVNGNRFVILFGEEPGSAALIQQIAMCDDFLADQVVFLKKSEDFAYEVEFFNRDGSGAKMCGNGLCASVRFALEVLKDDYSRVYTFIVNNTIYKGQALDNKNKITLPKPKILEIEYEARNPKIERYKFVDTGNKHLVCLLNTTPSVISDNEPEEMQARLKEFNIHFIRPSGGDLIIRSYERGVGWTRACGSGAVASAFAFSENRKLRVIHEGGVSEVTIHEECVTLAAECVLLSTRLD